MPAIAISGKGHRTILRGLLVSLGMWSTTHAQVAPAYELIDLGPTVHAGVPQINDHGAVVFGVSNGLVVWQDGSTSFVPGSRNGAFANGFNNRGDIVGKSGEGMFAAWIDGVLIDVSTVVPVRPTSVTAINNNQSYLVQADNDRSFLVYGDEVTEIGASYPRIWAESISDDGVVVGSTVLDSTFVPFAWDGTDVNILASWEGAARGISQHGLICGNRITSWPESEAFILEDGQFQFWERLPNTDDNRPLSINDDGVSVGYVERHGYEGAIWADEGSFFLADLILNGVGWEMGIASDINQYGQIAGVAEYGGVNHAVLLNPVPGPGGLALLAFGSLGVVRRRRHL